MARQFSIAASLPSADLFTILPSSEPAFLPPPAPGSTIAAPPVYIPDHIYQAALDPKVPITIAAVYAITVKLLNIRNSSRGKKPWRISRTRAFHWFVVAHNIFLAVYSAWTFVGMVGTMRRSVVSPMGADGAAGWADSLCRMNGPKGLGNGVAFDQAQSRWVVDSPDVLLSASGAPRSTDMGRIWNEGLAFYGWIFYLSKFYEVLDTFIILAKGKLSSTLQTYHHAGAMMCMWAGMRYMSAPIWMFVFVNSGIHAMMYTYYTLNVFSIKVPVIVKRTLTSMQITQFLVGASYAMAHSFVSYEVPYFVAEPVAAAAVKEEVNFAQPTPAVKSTFLLDTIRRIIAGSSSVAEPAPAAFALQNTTTTTTGSSASSLTDTTLTSQTRTVSCITTQGQTFAIWLNVLYLAPLTYLFVKFFITSYLKRADANARLSSTAAKLSVHGGTSDGRVRRLSHAEVAEEAGWDAARKVEREVYGDGHVEGAVVVCEDEEAERDEDMVKVIGNGNGKGSVKRRKAKQNLKA